MQLFPPVAMPSTTSEAALDGAISAFDTSKPVANFSPGPAPMPNSVMDEIQKEMLDYRGTGISVLSMSHRSPEFGAIIDDCRSVLRRVLRLPESHEILFTHGGGHGQFAAVPLNLCPGGPNESSADYFVHGSWGRRAAAEAAKYTTVRIAAETDGKTLPPRSSWDLNPNASYRYICSNETVDGNEYHTLPAFDDNVPLVVDMSSDICSKPIDWNRVGAAFACAPKNIGHAGLTVVVVRKDLLISRQAQPTCPGVLNWKINHESGAMWNTPPTFNVYTTGKVLHYIEDEGGLDAMERRAKIKSGAFYSCIEKSNGFYDTPLTNPAERSRMNAPFCVLDGDVAATNAFLIAAYEKNMVGFRTKTPFSMGKWLRASFYTGTTVEQAEALVSFMKDFAATYQKETLAAAAVEVSDAEPAGVTTHKKSLGLPPRPPSPLQPLRPNSSNSNNQPISRPSFGAGALMAKSGVGRIGGIKASMSLDSGLPSFVRA